MYAERHVVRAVGDGPSIVVAYHVAKQAALFDFFFDLFNKLVDQLKALRKTTNSVGGQKIVALSDSAHARPSERPPSERP